MNSYLAKENKIEILPEHLIDQIKAGEVIERPAALLKELIENSLDANSSKIDIQIVDNGMELISIEDNGHGITYKDLPLAFSRHATSKISKYEDLYSLSSFGFRGEALASISSISRVTCTSMTKDDESGGKIEIHGGKQKLFQLFKQNRSGTSIYINDLFYNTPVRLKFIKSKISEANAIKRIINSFIITNSQTTFTIKWDLKEKVIFPATNSSNDVERIKKIIFKKSKDSPQLIQFTNQYEGY